eukprot:CAMPEP_0195589180 /NCGR_PEP_ID=MMETSP0814-20130614/33505_1 /TAXON_ID=97485 /ORGANISM="Prymnesium parvum, Strain Texoma1" /LENGTH=412 /DNA_ID=CAMNT_0040728203 /DNA_START=209 /DNA_END=1447 /DNA_ORIENTATION=+
MSPSSSWRAVHEAIVSASAPDLCRAAIQLCTVEQLRALNQEAISLSDGGTQWIVRIQVDKVLNSAHGACSPSNQNRNGAGLAEAAAPANTVAVGADTLDAIAAALQAAVRSKGGAQLTTGQPAVSSGSTAEAEGERPARSTEEHLELLERLARQHEPGVAPPASALFWSTPRLVAWFESRSTRAASGAAPAAAAPAKAVAVGADTLDAIAAALQAAVRSKGGAQLTTGQPAVSTGSTAEAEGERPARSTEEHLELLERLARQHEPGVAPPASALFWSTPRLVAWFESRSTRAASGAAPAAAAPAKAAAVGADTLDAIAAALQAAVRSKGGAQLTTGQPAVSTGSTGEAEGERPARSTEEHLELLERLARQHEPGVAPPASALFWSTPRLVAWFESRSTRSAVEFAHQALVVD